MIKKNSKIAKSVHSTISDLHKAGIVDNVTMKKFDSLCLPKVKPITANKIKKLRQRENVSQPVFAKFLNVSPSTVKKWETGEKHPSGASARLLDLIEQYGLELIHHN